MTDQRQGLTPIEQDVLDTVAVAGSNLRSEVTALDAACFYLGVATPARVPGLENVKLAAAALLRLAALLHEKDTANAD